ncbi:septin B [Obelidium mucronatum]|nr:septin B [Obelidium mucronatum]
MPLEHALQFRGKFADPGPWKLPRSQPVRLQEPLGIGHLPAQRVRRSKRKPYVFNLMVVGDSGLGKTTFLNSLFNAPLSEDISSTKKSLAETKTVNMQPTTYELVEDGVILHLTVVDTPGFGDQLNRESDFLPIMEYVDEQYRKYHECERSDEMRKDIRDTRVHALLYFIPPTGNGLRDLDIEFMQRLCTKVNIIPVIGKADALMIDETSIFKKTILKDFQRYDIRVYPTHHSDERETVAEIEKHMPFAVIGSDDFIEVDGKKVRGRSYRWGSVEVENPKHCDFVYLRDMIIRTNLQDLIETTHNIHYALFRSSKIRGSIVGRPESILQSDEIFDQQVEGAQLNAKQEMQRKEEELKEAFVAKIREKENELREREEALNAKRAQINEEIERMKRQIEP